MTEYIDVVFSKIDNNEYCVSDIENRFVAFGTTLAEATRTFLEKVPDDTKIGWKFFDARVKNPYCSHLYVRVGVSDSPWEASVEMETALQVGRDIDWEHLESVVKDTGAHQIVIRLLGNSSNIRFAVDQMITDTDMTCGIAFFDDDGKAHIRYVTSDMGMLDNNALPIHRLPKEIMDKPLVESFKDILPETLLYVPFVPRIPDPPIVIRHSF